MLCIGEQYVSMFLPNELIIGVTFVVIPGHDAVLVLNGAPHTWAENIYFGHKILMKPSHDCSY